MPVKSIGLYRLFNLLGIRLSNLTCEPHIPVCDQDKDNSSQCLNRACVIVEPVHIELHYKPAGVFIVKPLASAERFGTRHFSMSLGMSKPPSQSICTSSLSPNSRKATFVSSIFCSDIPLSGETSTMSVIFN